MKIKEHKTVTSSGGDRHHIITIELYNREWKIAVNDNSIKKITTLHLWDKGIWRPFKNHNVYESQVHELIKSGQIVKFKYKV